MTIPKYRTWTYYCEESGYYLAEIWDGKTGAHIVFTPRSQSKTWVGKKAGRIIRALEQEECNESHDAENEIGA